MLAQLGFQTYFGPITYDIIRIDLKKSCSFHKGLLIMLIKIYEAGIQMINKEVNSMLNISYGSVFYLFRYQE